MTIHDGEHIAWRMIVAAQAHEVPTGPGELGPYLDEQVREAGGPRGALIGLLTAAGQIIQHYAEHTGEPPLALAERLRDRHSIEMMDIREFDPEEGDE